MRLAEIERLKAKYSLCEKSLQVGNTKVNIEEQAKTIPKHLIFSTLVALGYIYFKI